MKRTYDLKEKVLLWAMGFTLFHHIDHVLRSDHSGWPFKNELTPFTFSLLIYPLIIAVLMMKDRPKFRVAAVSFIAAFVLLAHTAIEPPIQVFLQWATNESTFHYTVGEHNLLDKELPQVAPFAALLQLATTGTFCLAALLFVLDYNKKKICLPDFTS